MIAPSKTFGIVACLKRGIRVNGAVLCSLCDGDGEYEATEVDVSMSPREALDAKDVCTECGGQGWLPDGPYDDDC